mgnify:FL=1
MEVANDFRALHCIGKIRERPNNQAYLEYLDGRNRNEVCTTDKIIGYRMRTISNKVVSLRAEEVREALLRQSIVISNLQLDSMGRIVSKKVDKSNSVLEDFRKTYDNMIDYEVIQFKEPLTNEQIYQIQTYLKKEAQEKNKRISYKLSKQALMFRE